jgi:DNA adenine methylase
LDFSNLFTWMEKDAFVYCDPPFVASDEFDTSFVSYTKGGFGMNEQKSLVDLARQARSRGAVMVISNHYTKETADLYADADKIEVFDVGRSISAGAEQRMKVKECLAVYGGSTK